MGIVHPVGLAFVIEDLIPLEQRRAECATCVARRRLNPDLIENSFVQNLCVGHAIERDPAGETKISLAGLLADVARHAKHDFPGHVLN